MKRSLQVLALVSAMMLAVPTGAARAEETPLITGEHWLKSTEQIKQAYLIGIANFAQLEVAFQGATPPSDAQSVVPRFARGLREHNLDSVREGLNNWYIQHPDQAMRPIIETIWFEMVVPGLNKSN